MAAIGSQRVILAHLPSGENQPQQLKAVLLADPKSGGPQCCLLSDQGALLELQHFKAMFSAWLLPPCNQVLADGSVFLATPLDPLLVLLPVLEAAAMREEEDADDRQEGHASGAATCPPSALRQGGVFRPLDQLLDGVQGQTLPAQCREGTQELLQAARPQLEFVCDVRDVDGGAFYRLNPTKALAWLLCKHTVCKEALVHQTAGLDVSMQDAFAASFLAEYLKPSWAAKLAQRLGVELTAPGDALTAGRKHGQGAGSADAQDKRPKSNPPLSAADAKQAARDVANKKAAESRQKAKQAAAAKEASTMKKISSFFSTVKK